MSWRKASAQPPTARTPSAVPVNQSALILIMHLSHMLGVDALQETRRLFQVKLRVMRQDAQKEPVVRGALEPLNVKQRVMRLRQPVQCQHAEYGKARGAQNRQLERDRNKCRPAVQRTTTDVHRIR